MELITTLRLADGREIELYLPDHALLRMLAAGWLKNPPDVPQPPFEIVTKLRLVQKTGLTDVSNVVPLKDKAPD